MKYQSDEILKFRNKLFNSVLVEGDKSVSDEKDLEEIIQNLPKLHITENWGKLGTKERKELDKVIAGYSGNGTPRERIESFITTINDKLSSKSPNSISDIFNTLVSIETISSILSEFSNPGIGFLFEAFLAAITGGTQDQLKENVMLSEVTDFTVDNGRYSVKVLKGGNVVNITGSKNELNKVLNRDLRVTYIVIEKYKDKLVFHIFDIVYESDLAKYFNTFNTSKTKLKDEITQFNINLKTLLLTKEFKNSTPDYKTFELSLDRQNVLNYVRKNLTTLQNKIMPLYKNLGAFTTDLTQYFSEPDSDVRRTIKKKAGTDLDELNKSSQEIVTPKNENPQLNLNLPNS